jgi:hypothetical protein
LRARFYTSLLRINRKRYTSGTEIQTLTYPSSNPKSNQDWDKAEAQLRRDNAMIIK